jgi:hypothetical protein
MKYMILITLNPAAMDALSKDEHDELMAKFDPFLEQLRASGELVGTQALAAPDQTTVVQVRNGAVVQTDGPYLESKEFLAGYYLVDTTTKERAVEIASQVPDAHLNTLEVREVIHSTGVDL